MGEVSLNAALRTITECLCPTQVEQLPVPAEIAPPALRREAATLVLGRRACQHDHPLHDVMENSTHRKRLVTSPSHSPCSITSVLCPSTRDGETLHTCKVGRVVGIHHHETAQIHPHATKQRRGCGSIPMSLDPAKQVTDWCWQIWGKRAALGIVHEQQL